MSEDNKDDLDFFKDLPEKVEKFLEKNRETILKVMDDLNKGKSPEEQEKD